MQDAIARGQSPAARLHRAPEKVVSEASFNVMAVFAH